MVVKQNGKLRVYNRIYEFVFDNKWINQTLTNLRPYTKELAAWLNSNRQDKSYLLRGQKLQEAQQWQKGKELLVEDYQFLNTSQEIATRRQLRFFILLAPLLVLIPVVGWQSFQIARDLVSDQVKGTFLTQSFSQGERTLFGGSENPSRAQAFIAFQNKDYPQAVEYFQKARQAFPYDPELRIYYNNARAYQQGNPLTLAVVLPDTNKESKISQELLRGVAQAQDNFNSLGGVNKQFLNIVIANDGSDKTQAQKVAEELIKNQNILGVIGHYTSTNSQAALPLYEKAGVAMISPGSTSTSINSKVFFRTVLSAKVDAEELTDYAKKYGYKRVVIFYNPHDIYSNDVKKEFENLFISDNNGEVIYTNNLADASLNTSAEISKVKEKNADAIVLFPNTELTSVALAIARAQGSKKLPLLGGNALYNQDTLKSGGDAFEGLVICVDWFAEDQNSKKFAEEAKGIWGGQISWRTATAYDATRAFIKAISMYNSPSRQTVLQNLKSINLSSTETSGYPLYFDDRGDRQQKPVLVKVVKGSDGLFKFEQVK
ncbi:ABC transporter substrate-binding protein [Nostoc sp.]|uniref:ABC transporter substrate-binding protein n=1 Tax=Nostoc sp. TaxID=1180 RepID=UPI002FFA657E